jgi:MFS family permease
MIGLECVTGSGIAVFYPASNALLPKIVPADLLTQASALSRLAMNAGQMVGAAVAGLVVAATGPGWALSICGFGMVGTVPVLLMLRAAGNARTVRPSMIRELHDGWSEVRSRTWFWVTVLQYSAVMMAWYGGFQVLGPVVARAHLGGPAAWGAITASESVGLIGGGLVALRFSPRRPMVFVVLVGMLVALPTLALAALWPLPLVCVCSLVVGIVLETMMVVWTVTMTTSIPPDRLARVSSYDAFGSIMAMPVGALAAGPIAAAIGVSTTQYGAAAIIIVASALAFIPREIRKFRAGGTLALTMESDNNDQVTQEPATPLPVAEAAAPDAV